MAEHLWSSCGKCRCTGQWRPPLPWGRWGHTLHTHFRSPRDRTYEGQTWYCWEWQSWHLQPHPAEGKTEDITWGRKTLPAHHRTFKCFVLPLTLWATIRLLYNSHRKAARKTRKHAGESQCWFWAGSRVWRLLVALIATIRYLCCGHTSYTHVSRVPIFLSAKQQTVPGPFTIKNSVLYIPLSKTSSCL